MNIELHNLWATPVMVVRNAAPLGLQKAIIDSVDAGRYANIKRLHDEPKSCHEIHDLIRVIETHAASLATKFFGKQSSASVGEIWLNDHEAEDSASVHRMHAHARYHMVCTYYPMADGGDIHLFNPNGGTIWSVAASKGIANNFTLTPEPGMMIFFPGYVVHNTTPNLSGKRRICMPSNIMLNFQET